MADPADELIAQVKSQYPGLASWSDSDIADNLQRERPDLRPYLRKYTAPNYAPAPDIQAQVKDAANSGELSNRNLSGLLFRPSTVGAIPTGIIRGVEDTGIAAGSPGNLVGMAALAIPVAKPFQVVKQLIAGGFGLGMIKSAVAKYPEARQAIQSGNSEAAANIITQMVAGTGMGVMGIKEGAKFAEDPLVGAKIKARPDPYVEAKINERLGDKASPQVEAPPQEEAPVPPPSPDPNQGSLFNPPIEAPETVRVYRGQNPNKAYPPSVDQSEAGRWFHPDRDTAALYGQVRSVDIPKDVYDNAAAEQAEAYRQGAGGMWENSITVPAEYANRAQPEIVQTPEGPVAKNAPPSPDLTRDLNEALEAHGVDPQRPQEIADKLADIQGTTSPEISEATEPISSTEGNQVKIEPGVDPAPKVAHEMLHVAEDQGAPIQVPEGPGANDAITAATSDTLKTVGSSGIGDWSQGQTDYAAPPSKPMDPSLRGKALRTFIQKWYPEYGTTQPQRSGLEMAKAEKLSADAFLNNNDAIADAEHVVDQMTPEDKTKFLDVLHGNRENSWPALEPFVRMMRRLEDRDYTRVQSYNPSLRYVENHFTSRWKSGPEGDFVPPPGSDLPKAEAPEGTMTNFFERTGKSPSEMIKAGYVPTDTNGVRMWKQSMMDNAKFIGVARMIKAYEGMGTMRRFGPDSAAPKDWVKIDSKLSDVIEGSGNGPYYADPGVARMINRWTERNPFGSMPAMQALAAYKTFSTANELLGAGPHAVNIASVAAATEMSRGLSAVNRGEVAKGGGSILSGLSVAPAVMLREARANDFMRQAALPPGERAPSMEDHMMGLFGAGLKLSMSKADAMAGLKAMVEALVGQKVEGTEIRQPNYTEALAGFKKVMTDFPAQVGEPLFRLILKHKGLYASDAASDMMAQEAPRLARGEITKAEIYKKAVRSADAAFGMVNYKDNLMWDGVLKQALHLAVRAPGWVAGTFEVAGHALKDAKDNLSDWATGDDPIKFSPRTATAMFAFLPVALASAIVQLTRTGTLPQSTKDIIHPQVGGTDDRGHPNRASIFGYPKEWESVLNNPIMYAYNKRAGWIARAQEAWEGKNFYGRDLYKPTDDFAARFGKGLVHQIPVPFALTGYQEAKARGESSVAPWLSAIGIRPASTKTDNTPADDLIDKYLANQRPAGGDDDDLADKRQQQASWARRLRVNPSDETVQQEMDAANASAKLRKDTYKWAAEDPLTARFARLQLPQARQVYERSNEEERKRYGPILRKMVGTAQESIRKGRLKYPEDRQREAEAAMSDLNAVQ